MVGYVRPKNLRDILIRALLPPPPCSRTQRPAQVGFKPCGRRANCTLCRHSPGPISSYMCPFSSTRVTISRNITCTDVGIYLLLCEKKSGSRSTLHPTYVGECGDGYNSSFTHRLAGHLSSANDGSQHDTEKPVGRHFRLPGHNTNQDLIMIPIEKIEDNFIRKAREALYIKKFKTLKRLTVTDCEHGLNMSPGQTF